MLTVTHTKGDKMDDNLKPKRVKVSKQRQISIPKEFFDLLNFSDEALVEVSNNTLIIRPAQNENLDFSEFILKDLIAEGYAGDELLYQFKEVKSKLPEAIDKMTEEALKNKPLSADMSLDDFLDEDEHD